MYLKKVLKITEHEVEVELACSCTGKAKVFVDNTETSFTEEIPNWKCKGCDMSEVQKLRRNY